MEFDHIEISTSEICIDVTGPDWRVSLGRWLKSGGVGILCDCATLSEALTEAISAIGDIPKTSSILSLMIALVRVSRRFMPEIKIVRYGSTSGSLSIQGEVQAANAR